MQKKTLLRREKWPHLHLLGSWPVAFAQDSAGGIQAGSRPIGDFQWTVEALLR